MKLVKGKIIFDSPAERRKFLRLWDSSLYRMREKTGLSHEQEIGIGMFRVSLIGYRKGDKELVEK